MMKRQINYSEEDERNRWRSYAEANSTFPLVRTAEVNIMMKYVNPQKGEKILEVGTGNGVLTYPIVQAVGRKGLLYSFDYRKENLFHAIERNTEGYPIVFVPQRDNPQLATYTFPLTSNSIDKVVSLAAFHHYDDRSLGTGTSGRLEALKEFYRILTRNGELIIGDIVQSSSTQRYFDKEMDNVNSPAYCSPRGHPHDFVDEKLIGQLCKKAGFRNVRFSLEKTPLTFKSEEEAGTFLKMIHNASCHPLTSLEVAKKHKKFEKKNGFYELDWEIFCLKATK